MNSDTLAVCVADCEDSRLQYELGWDLWEHMWSMDDAHVDLPLTKEDVEFASTKFHQGDMLDIMWSSCRLGLN